MLSAKYRIPASVLPLVARKGRRKNHPSLTVVQYTDSEAEHPRFCFVVSKKVEQTATGRNRIKRRLRSVVYRLMQSERLNRTDYYMFLAKNPTLGTIPFEKLQQIVESLL